MVDIYSSFFLNIGVDNNRIEQFRLICGVKRTHTSQLYIYMYYEALHEFIDLCIFEHFCIYYGSLISIAGDRERVGDLGDRRRCGCVCTEDIFVLCNWSILQQTHKHICILFVRDRMVDLVCTMNVECFFCLFN